MTRSFFISFALLALQVVAQSATPYTDANTGITFNGFKDELRGFTFGIALPKSPSTDFIAQIQSPITEGWAGFSMGQSMVGNLLAVAWPTDGKVVSSFRLATGYTSPATATGSFSMAPIPAGTFVNKTAFSYTFLCSKCISEDPATGFVISPDLNIIGWAQSNDALSDPSSASVALTYHNAGFGAFGMPLDNAKSADFDKWAALAVENGSGSGNSTSPPIPPPGTGNNSTTPITGGNATIANRTYDYIVAGAGPAGIIAAERLAKSGASVLLIERGGPSLASSGNTKTLDWNSSVTMYDVPAYGYYLSDVGSPAFCSDTADQAGCLLGGGSSVNAMMYVKPQDKDFDDHWPTGWKSADVAAAADRVWERNPGQTYGSEDGERYNDEAYSVLSEFFASQGWAETDFIKEPNSKKDVFGHPPWLAANGLRSGAVRTYLPSAQALPNFELMMNTKVIRAVRESSSISGVEVESDAGKRVIYNLNAGGRVLLAAGAMSTPRILFNSGIGPVKQLQTVATGSSGVSLPAEADWIDLPVGEEIKDHPIFTIKFNTSTPMHSEPKAAFTTPNQTTIDRFAKGSGILAQSGQRLNWWSSVKTSTGKEIFFQGTCNGPAENQIQMKVYITHGSESVGSLGITSDGATTFIKNPHMTSAVDTQAATAMMDRLIRMTSGSNSTLSLLAPAGVSNVTGADLIKEFKTGSHYVGTAKMGTKGSAGVVVDINTKVYGTDNLFVVDASMHPDLPTGNTQAIIMVAAEAAAARILALGGASGTPSPKPVPSGSVPVASSTALPIAAPSSTTTPVAPPPAPVQSAHPVVSDGPATPAPSNPGSSTANAYERCGGVGHDGPTGCQAGWSCKVQNDWYSQCLPASRARSEQPSPVQKRTSILSRRDGKLPIAPGLYENEVTIARRDKMIRASYLDMYSS
ncbi:choline dehydrogenase [Phaeosphaeria sp. MPI-PUGE-AT-0046c]|nr:choline dehydrogenase [Phaeosphaeria sp. MPI-PUGE-AT-0046c]